LDREKGGQVLGEENQNKPPKDGVENGGSNTYKKMKIRISTRLVLIFEKRVIKIPLSYRGYLQCKNEKFIWEKYKHTGVLAELYSERFGIVVMKRYPVANRVPEYVVYGLKREIPEFDIPNCDLYRKDNWGITENLGHILIDYGINERISKMY
jgi:hypothetical protein